MSGAGPLDPGKLTLRRRAIKLCMLVSESNSCRSAYRFMRAFLIPSLDQLHLVTAISSEAGRPAALARQRELVEAELIRCAQCHVVLKEEEYTLYESLARYIASSVRPDIIFMGSTNLCTSVTSGASASTSRNTASRNTPGPAASGPPQLRRQTSIQRGTGAAGGGVGPSAAGGGSGAAGAAASGLGMGMGIGSGGLGLGGSCIALKVLAELRCAPVLLAKYNSRGSWLTASAALGSAAASGTGSLVLGGAAAAVAAAAAAAAAGGGPGSSPSGSNPSGGLASTAGLNSSRRNLLGGGGGFSAASGFSTPSQVLSRPASAMVRSTSMSSHGGGGGGAAGSSSSYVPPMRVMVDLQPNSRHVLDWLFEHFTAGRDHLVLTVSQAYDDQHRVKPAAQRLLMAFGVAAAVNSFEADTAVLAGPANKSLPQAVMDSEPDLLVLQAPRCRGLPGTIVELLYSARTSFLIWPPDYKAAAAR